MCSWLISFNGKQETKYGDRLCSTTLDLHLWLNGICMYSVYGYVHIYLVMKMSSHLKMNNKICTLMFVCFCLVLA